MRAVIDGTIGFVGLGNMGGPMAGHLAASEAASGRDVLCYDAAGTQGRAHPAARVAASAAEIAATCRIVLTSLPDGPVVNEVLNQIIGSPDRKTRVFVDLSTIGTQWARRNADDASSAGIDYVDAPVSGGVAGAVAGSITVMCSGSRSIIDELTPLLLEFSGHVFHVGTAPGNAQAMKVLNNFLSGTAMAATSEAIAFGVRQGLDMQTMLDVLNVSSGQNTATRDKFPAQIVTGKYAIGFRVDQLNKDLGLYAEAADEAGCARPVSGAVIDLWREVGAEEARADMAEVYRVVSRR